MIKNDFFYVSCMYRCHFGTSLVMVKHPVPPQPVACYTAGTYNEEYPLGWIRSVPADLTERWNALKGYIVNLNEEDRKCVMNDWFGDLSEEDKEIFLRELDVWDSKEDDITLTPSPAHDVVMKKEDDITSTPAPAHDVVMKKEDDITSTPAPTHDDVMKKEDDITSTPAPAHDVVMKKEDDITLTPAPTHDDVMKKEDDITTFVGWTR